MLFDPFYFFNKDILKLQFLFNYDDITNFNLIYFFLYDKYF